MLTPVQLFRWAMTGTDEYQLRIWRSFGNSKSHPIFPESGRIMQIQTECGWIGCLLEIHLPLKRTLKKLIFSITSTQEPPLKKESSARQISIIRIIFWLGSWCFYNTQDSRKKNIKILSDFMSLMGFQFWCQNA